MGAWPIFPEVAVTSGFGDAAQPSFQEEPYIRVHRGTFDVVEPENFRDGSKRLQTEPAAYPGLWAAGDEELDVRDLVKISGEYGENGGCRFLVLAFIQSVNDYCG